MGGQLSQRHALQPQSGQHGRPLLVIGAQRHGQCLLLFHALVQPVQIVLPDEAGLFLLDPGQLLQRGAQIVQKGEILRKALPVHARTSSSIAAAMDSGSAR